MKMYVGVTDFDWYTTLKASDCDEVNFWTPGATNFKAIEENDMFLFKLHSPNNYIVGGGFYVRFLFCRRILRGVPSALRTVVTH